MKDVQDSESAIDDERLSVQRPDPSILGHLLSHIASSDYSCISLFDGTSPDTDVGGKLNNPKIRWGNALHLLLAYTLGSPVTFTRSPTFKGKEKDQAESRRFKRRFLMGLLEFEPSSPQGGYLLETLLRALTACAEASIVNLFTIQTHLPHLSEWLIMRIYGPAPDREYAITFPPREGWAAKGPGGEAEGEPPVWRAPSPSLRRAYLALLRKMLEAGASREITWRLFALVRREDTTQPLRSPSPGASASSSPSPSPYASPTPHHGALVGSPTPSGENTPSKSKRKRPPGLLKLQLPSSDGVRVERLDEEVLDLIGHGIKSRWPALFVLSGGVGEVGGLELRDSGRNWSKGEKGISFSVGLEPCWNTAIACEMVYADVAGLDIHNKAQPAHHAPPLFSSRCSFPFSSRQDPRELPNQHRYYSTSPCHPRSCSCSSLFVRSSHQYHRRYSAKGTRRHHLPRA